MHLPDEYKNRLPIIDAIDFMMVIDERFNGLQKIRVHFVQFVKYEQTTPAPRYVAPNPILQ